VKREGVVIGEDKDIIFRASPDFMGSPWYDWVDIDWGHDGVVPAHLRLFFRVTAFLPGVDSICLDHDVYLANSGVFAVMESLEQSLTSVPSNERIYGANFKAHQGSRLVRWVYKEEIEDGLPKLRVAEVNTIANVVVAIPDSAPPEDGGLLCPSWSRNSPPYLFLVPPSIWHSHYHDIMKEHKRRASSATSDR
jgi:hypothetical protein